MQLLAECTKAMTSNNSECTVPSPLLAAYVEQTLASFDKRNQSITEKRITDILFEIEMNSNDIRSTPQFQTL